MTPHEIFATSVMALCIGVVLGMILRGSDNRAQLETIIQQGRKALSAIDDLQKAQAAEKADLASLGGLITQLLTAFVNGTITPTQASDLLNEMNAEDATIQTNIASINATLNPPPPTPVP